jgi:DNA-directed RNA polymerase subunit beta'
LDHKDFDALRISLASPETVRSWSYGEVTKPETINYRRLRPERDGLFCEAIFGPTRDWQCACGKYKHVRFRGVKCERCGVEVTRSLVRRERMGHIELAAPVAHIWYTRRVPSYLGLLLNVSRRNMDRVLYFAQYVITRVDEDSRTRALRRLNDELDRERTRMERAADEQSAEIDQHLSQALETLEQRREELESELEQKAGALTDQVMGEARALQSRLEAQIGQKVDENIQVTFADQPLIQADETIERSHLGRLNEWVGTRLDEIKTDIRKEQEDALLLISADADRLRHEASQATEAVQERLAEDLSALEASIDEQRTELKNLAIMTFLTESQYYDLDSRWGHVFEAKMGAEAFYDICVDIDLDGLGKELRHEMHTTRSKQKRKKATKRLRVVESLRKSGNRPEWMILTMLPVIPPELRPMIQLDGGRFATSDLNDLYRRVVNRNNRLKRLLELGAPDVIVRNEKRMLQEAVDSLIDNSRRGKAVSARGRRPLKSLSDMLKGKQGRFRRNLLGKRVDYSGRSVIVVGPDLKLHQCGLPKSIALELFQPFVINKLVDYNYAINVKGAKRVIEQQRPEVWEVLEEVVKERPVLLNRAPTLHRLGIQAFDPVLVEGDAIQIHPLVCAAFNADFDGDQMAVHVPLSQRAVTEARELMLSTRNLLKPASGEPIVGPAKDMVLGCYYLTMERPEQAAGGTYGSIEEVILAHELRKVRLHTPIRLRFRSWLDDEPMEFLELKPPLYGKLAEAGFRNVGAILDRLEHNPDKLSEALDLAEDELRTIQEAIQNTGFLPEDRRAEPYLDTTVGRVIFNSYLPPQLRFVNDNLDKGDLQDLVAECYHRLGTEATVQLVDRIKEIGFHYATRSGVTIAVSDITVPPRKYEIIDRVSDEVGRVEHQYRRGLITEDEQYVRTVELWTKATDDITSAVASAMDPLGPIRVMAVSGATKGGFTPIRQLAGMRGLMADPAGRIIALPIRSNFREGLTALEYFISTHGARKGLADTALRTADAGYLTRRLVDVSQDVITNADDCGTRSGIWVTREDTMEMGQTMVERLAGRYVARPVVERRTGEVLVAAGEMITEEAAMTIQNAEIERVYVRSPLACQLRQGLCATCYGRDLARGGIVRVGEAVGIIAAQSIGEPGTQLTLRTFHTGGVAGASDITHGLPRVQELFEARVPKGEAIISDIDGRVELRQEEGIRQLKVTFSETLKDDYEVPRNYRILVQDGQSVVDGQPIAEYGDKQVTISTGGKVLLQLPSVTIKARVREYEQAIPSNYKILVEDEQWVRKGEAIAQYGPRQVVAEVSGTANVLDHTAVSVHRERREEREYDLPTTARLRVQSGEMVKAGQQLTDGSIDPNRMLRILGREPTQLYLLTEIQRVYRSQGVNINDKHVEVIIRQMTNKVRVASSGDTDLLPGELVDRLTFADMNAEITQEGGRRATARPVLLGITKAALNTESFLSASSFQHTINVLAGAAIEGKCDQLYGLKENVIIGKLIPAGTGYRRRAEESAVC